MGARYGNSTKAKCHDIFEASIVSGPLETQTEKAHHFTQRTSEGATTMATTILRRSRRPEATMRCAINTPKVIGSLFGVALVVLVSSSLPWRLRVMDEGRIDRLPLSTLRSSDDGNEAVERFETQPSTTGNHEQTFLDPPVLVPVSNRSPSHRNITGARQNVSSQHHHAGTSSHLTTTAKKRQPWAPRRQHHDNMPEHDSSRTTGYTTADAMVGRNITWGWNVPGVSKMFYTRGIGRSFGPTMKLPTPVLVVGMPKSGTSSLRDFFRCNGHNSSHWQCLGASQDYPAYCAHAIRHNIAAGRPALYNTGNYQVYAQMDVELPASSTYELNDRCYMPQVNDLEKLHESHPNATFILNHRDVSTWINSLRHFMKFDEKLRDCNLTDFPPGVGETDEELATFYHNHLNNIREFVKRHPSHALVEVDIESPTAGRVLADAFGLQDACWVKRNARPVIDTTGQEANLEQPGALSVLPLIGDNETWGTNVRGVSRTFYTRGMGESFGSPLRLPLPVLVVGLPKLGITRLSDFFLCNGHNASRYWCSIDRDRDTIRKDSETHRPKSCGMQIWENIYDQKLPAFSGIANYNVYTELGAVWPIDKPPDHPIVGQCYMPQVNDLEEIHLASPNATWILNTANPDHWIESLKSFHGWYDKIRNCELRDFPLGDPNTTTHEHFWRFYRQHNDRVRRFARDHPSHKLIEIDVEDSRAGQMLADSFGLRKECWAERRVKGKKRVSTADVVSREIRSDNS